MLISTGERLGNSNHISKLCQASRLQPSAPPKNKKQRCGDGQSKVKGLWNVSRHNRARLKRLVCDSLCAHANTQGVVLDESREALRMPVEPVLLCAGEKRALPELQRRVDRGLRREVCVHLGHDIVVGQFALVAGGPGLRR